MEGPFNVLLRSPELGDAAQRLGAQIRFHSSLPKKLNEFAILISGRYWSAEYEFYAHSRLALAAGLSRSIVDALAAGVRPPSMDAGERAVYEFATELWNKHRISDATFRAAQQQFGERGVVDLTSLLGYYSLVSMLLNVDNYQLPDGVRPVLKAVH